jgi:hypothetical protein
MPPSKPVTLLKRGSPLPPSAPATATVCAPAPPVLADRVADAVRTAVDGALKRERARLDVAYRAREEALLLAVTDVLQSSLRDVVSNAAAREADALATAVRNIAAKSAIAKKMDKPAGGKQTSEKKKKAIAEEHAVACRKAFKTAFEKELLGSIEKSMRAMMTAVSKVVDTEFDASLAAPVALSATRIRTAADSVREDASELSLIAASSDEIFAAKSAILSSPTASASSERKLLSADDVMRSDLDVMFAEGRIRDAIVLTVQCSPTVQSEAVHGILESRTPPEDVIAPSGETKAGALSPDVLIQFMAALSNDISEGTSDRLAWIYEAVLAVQDAMQDKEDVDDRMIEEHAKLLSATAASLRQVHAGGTVSSSDAKLAKLLVRAVESTSRSLNR